jgi:hypothetical protein
MQQLSEMIFMNQTALLLLIVSCVAFRSSFGNSYHQITGRLYWFSSVAIIHFCSLSRLTLCIVCWHGLGNINGRHLIFRVRTAQSPGNETWKGKRVIPLLKRTNKNAP